jgi:CheY-like chemotaxis protein
VRRSPGRVRSLGMTTIGAFRDALGGVDPFAVVITDLGMPYMDGRHVARAV